ncbi:hypothetical protein GCM10008959_22490 [Deinococcus seoulensis]|uniref:Type II toxin-antitoxin system PemK/MazF family toxin n=1 Tax=Deinococcus seoulensis TaxID=1837379 RepID=A0ABQ2RU77_9DEIO|nr:hypothetical protein GCM10008959_22490 [Deinococcus seoulensis]
MSGSVALKPGDVIVARLPQQVPNGREQEGYRPAVVVGLPQRAGTDRYPMILVVPVTTHRGQPWASAAPGLYPILPAGAGGLPVDSVVLTDQLRALDAGQVARRLNTLTTTEYAPVHTALRSILSL